MASKSLNIEPVSKPLTSKTHSHCDIVRFTLAFALVGLAGSLWSCNPPANKIPSTDTPSPSYTATSQLSSTPSQSATPSVSPTVTFTPTSTPTPFGTPIDILSWPDGGPLLQPVDIQVKFGTSLDDLPSGPYLLYQDQETRGLDYSSFDGSTQGSLFAFEPPYSVSTFSRGNISLRTAGIFEMESTTRYVIDMTRQTVLKLEPFCHVAIGSLSPNGQFLALICTPRRVQLNGEIAVEVVSLEDGSCYHLILPFPEKKRYTCNLVKWVTDESFIAFSGPEEGPCLVSIPDMGMRCPPELKDKEDLFLAVSPYWLIVKDRENGLPIANVFPISCFYDPQECKPAFTIDNVVINFTRFRISPDGSMIALDSSYQRTSTTSEIGYYDTETWTYHKIGVFARDYGLFGWCPDSSCMLIVGETYYLAYPDGRTERMPINPDHPLAIIEVP